MPARWKTGGNGMPHILVVANETVGGGKLLRLVRARARTPNTTFTLIVPMTRPRSGLVIYDEAVRDSAQVRIDLALSYLKGVGISASGEVGDPDPLTATMNGRQLHRVDSVIVPARPWTRSGWLRADLIDRLRKSAYGVEVEHVVAEREAAKAS